MEFDYDMRKSASNKIKHAIDFVEAAQIWDDEDFLIVPVRSDTEPRFAAIGRIGDKIWTVVFTPRDGKIRVISARRARKKEIAHYEQSKND